MLTPCGRPAITRSSESNSMMASPKPERVPLPSRNPLPLSSAQEAQVNDLYYKRVRAYCADEIRGLLLSSTTNLIPPTNTASPDFASCATNRTISATWACRSQRLAMNGCMIAHASQEEQDAAREEWFATRDERIRQREEKEREKKKQEKFHREWWGLPPPPIEEHERKGTDEKR